MPSVVFTKPGQAHIAIGDLTLHLTPEDADGDPTVLGEINVTCTVTPHQNDDLASFQILAPAASSTSPRASSAPPAPKSPTGTPPASPTPTVSPSASITDPATPTAPASTAVQETSAAPTNVMTSEYTTDPSPVAASADSLGPLLLVFTIVVLGAAFTGGIWWHKRRRATSSGGGEGSGSEH